MSDTARTNAYRQAIRRLVRAGDVVLDVGAGTGILAFFACEAGARRVYAVEDDPTVAAAAALLAKRVPGGDRVAVIRAHSTKATLPEPADVLVTETLGPFGLDEGILRSVIDARRRLLRSGGVIIPARLALSIAPVEAPDVFATAVGWWTEPHYGLDLSLVKSFAANTPAFARFAETALLSDPAVVADVDFQTVERPALSAHVSFACRRDGVVHGFAGWFAATLAPGLVLSNATPGATHWRHVFLPIEEPAVVRAGTRIGVTLELDERNGWRWHGRIEASPAVAFDQSTWFGAPVPPP